MIIVIISYFYQNIKIKIKYFDVETINLQISYLSNISISFIESLKQLESLLNTSNTDSLTKISTSCASWKNKKSIIYSQNTTRSKIIYLPQKQITEVLSKLLFTLRTRIELNDLTKIAKVNKPSMTLNQL